MKDRGSVLVIAVVLVTVAATGVTRLVAHTQAVQRSSAAARLRFTLDTTAESAVRLVADAGTCSPTARAVALNGHTATVTCSSTSTGGETNTTRRGVITITNSASTSSFTPPTWAGSTATAIAGDIVVNTGTATSPSSALLDDTSPSWQTQPVAWTSHVTIPPVPPLPAFERPGPLVVRNGCSVYYPGRYLGSTTLALTGGQHYFASGVYYIERPMTITAGARVVMGAGDHTGCFTDNQAVSDSDAPSNHALSGRGVTIIFGASGRLTVQESSLIINRRLASPDTADSHDIALRTVTTGVNTTTLNIPADQMRRSDGSLGAVTGYLTSTLSPTLNWALDVRLNGTAVTSNRVIIEGHAHLPVSGSRFTSTATTYGLRMNRGLTTSRVTFALSNAPSDAANYRLGFVPRPGRMRTVLQATISALGRQAMADYIRDE